MDREERGAPLRLGRRGPGVLVAVIGLINSALVSVPQLAECKPDVALLIAITGWAQDSDKEQSRAAGFDHHLTKPIEPERLIDLLGAP